MKAQEKLQEELTEMIHSWKIPIFEIEVKDTRTGADSYLVFDISVDDEAVRGEHEATTKEEDEQKLIPFVSVDIEEGHDLSAHLESLYSECIDKIIVSEYFDLRD